MTCSCHSSNPANTAPSSLSRGRELLRQLDPSLIPTLGAKAGSAHYRVIHPAIEYQYPDFVTEVDRERATGGHALWELVRTARVAERRFGEVFAHFGLTPAQYGVLASLADGENLSQAELARAVLVRPQSLGAVLDTLVAAGLIVREGRRGRGRRQTLSLSERGHQIFTGARPAAYALLRPEVTGLDAEKTEQLTGLLQTVRQHLHQPLTAERARNGAE